MKKTFLLLFSAVILAGCTAGTRTIPKAIYAVARHDRYSGVNASREYFRRGETPCVKIAGYGSSTFSYRLYKEGMLKALIPAAWIKSATMRS